MNIYRKIKTYILQILTLTGAITAVLLLSGNASAITYTPLITNISQIQGLGGNLDAKIIDYSTKSGEQPTFPMDTQFTVTLGAPVHLDATNGLILYSANMKSDGAPTLVQVEGRNGASDIFSILGYAHLHFRGIDGTHEFSSPIYSEESRDVAELRLTVLRVAQPSADSNAGFRICKLNLFQYRAGDLYPNDLIDPLRDKTDYYHIFKDYTYQSNAGVLDPRNQYEPNDKYPTETPWGEGNTFVYQGKVQELPTFNSQGGGQMPHVTQQTLYAMPGDIISLSPYYDLPTSVNYKERYSHWYGYNPRRGDLLQPQDYHHIYDSEGNRLLDFLIDPAEIVLTDNAGYFGGTSFPRSIDNYIKIDGVRTFVIYNAQTFNNFAAMVNGGQTELNAILANDIECWGRAMTKIGGYVDGKHVAYRGKFNGNGHSIRYFTLSEDEEGFNTGIFGGVAGGVEIYNLKVEEADIKTGGRAGVLIGTVYDTEYNTLPVNIHNCLVQGTVTYTAQEDRTVDGNYYQMARGGGIIGCIEGADSPIAVNLEKVGFVGKVMGGYGSRIFNAALIGNTGDNPVTVKDCYAKGVVENVRAVYGESICAVGNSNWNHNLTVENSYIDLGTDEGGIDLQYKVYQTGFTNIYPADPGGFHLERNNYAVTSSQGEKQCAYFKKDPGEQKQLYMWREKDGVVTQLLGAWPGRALESTPEGGCLRFSDEEWENLQAHDDWMFIVNKGNNGALGQTSDCKFPVGEYDYYLFDNVKWKTEGGGQPTFTSNRSIFARSEREHEYILTVNHRDGKEYLTVDGAVLGRDGVTWYVIFNIPQNFKDVTYRLNRILQWTPPQGCSNPMPTPSNVYRFYVHPEIDWENLYCDLKAGYVDDSGEWVSVAPWESKAPDGTVNIDGKDYFYFDLPKFSPVSADGKLQKWEVSFSNGAGESYEGVVKQYATDMILTLKEAGLPYGEDGAKIGGVADGAIYFPAFYHYLEGIPVLKIYNQNDYYIGETFDIDGGKYYLVNLAIPFNDKSQFSFSEVDNDFREPGTSQILYDDYRCHFFNDSAWIRGKKTMQTPAIVMAEYTGESPHTIYTDEREFYDEVLAEGLGWSDRMNGAPAPAMESQEVDIIVDYDKVSSHNLRWYGTEATFYQPYKTAFAPDSDENLHLEQPEYYVAADFGHEFRGGGTDRNLDRDEKVIYEPVINFRHVFHIKDGKDFADANTISKEANEEYLFASSRAISARAGYDFQIRLTQQVPVYQENLYNFFKTNFYYKKGEGVYDRVPRVGIEVRDEDGNLVQNQGMFFFDAFTGTQGNRKYPETGIDFFVSGVGYHVGNGSSQVYRSLFCKAENAVEGTYIVRLQALDKDGDAIKILGTDDNLYIDQYVVTFVAPSEASVLREEDLDKEENYTHTTEYLEQEDVCGAPAITVDYDQYRAFLEEPYNIDDFFRHDGDGAADEYSYRWPAPWDKSTYSFGFGGYYDYDFNEYIISNHSNEVRYHAAADDHVNKDGTKGLYDRLYYDTYAKDPANAQKGFFYYTNAASDPGVAARLRINNLCPGSTVAVSAWVAEFSYENEVANLCFNFVAVDGDGNREVVHSFITGYIDNLNYGSQEARATNKKQDFLTRDHGNWMHIYFSFIPDLSTVKNLTMIDHYELELENNCVSSIGADYAVDDIRAYIISPAITARQLSPLCDANQAEVGIRIRSRFDKLLVSNGLEESLTEDAAQEVSLNFAVLDKSRYDALYSEYLNTDYADAAARAAALDAVVEKSVVRVAPDPESEGEPGYFVPMNISTYFNSIREYNERTLNMAMRYTSPSSRTKYVQANIQPVDEEMRAGKEYYIVLYSQYGDLPKPEDAGLSIFAVTDDPCAKYAVMTIQGSGTVKVDGIAYTSGEPIDVCVGQSPVVQVDLKMISEGREVDIYIPQFDDYDTAPTHYYDWFVGSVEEFMRADENGVSPYDLLYIFRNGTTPSEGAGNSTEGNVDATELPEAEEGAADMYAHLRRLVAEERLVLHASSFVFPPLVEVQDPDHILCLTAMPILSHLEAEEGYKICSQPSEIRLRIQNSSPLMRDGFFQIQYPEGFDDVPVRVGYRQLGEVSGLSPLTLAGESVLTIDRTVEVGAGMCSLQLPLRGLRSYKGEDEFAAMTMAGNRNEAADPYVYLVETNDPAYISLDRHPSDAVGLENSLLPIGMVGEMNARTDGRMTNYATILFDGEMQFSEGYYYKVRFAFDEVIPTEVEGYCEGHVVFTIKVVPEYMKWTGTESRNWNNDRNWSRVTAAEILLPEGDERIQHHTVDGDGSRMAYAPLDFTKTLIAKLAEDEESKGYPVIFTAEEQSIFTLQGIQMWSRESAPASASGMEATPDIEYDMAAMTADENILALRPWYANTCEQIHFNHGAELTGQEHFRFGKHYQKAWVDMEMTGDRWYTLASPLQGVVAGDMYTKSASALQDTELFKDINFTDRDDNGNPLYGRFAPAVYQRGWNKGETKTYMLEDGTNEYRSSAVALNWSRVYNDVDEDYAPGTGFSIRTVTENIAGRKTDEEGYASVLFRLPKGDSSYSYFDPSGNSDTADDKVVNRNGESRYALTDFSDGSHTVTLNVGAEGRYFLAGNPFIARMRMDRFLAENADVLEPAYWIMTSDRQDAYLWNEKAGTFIGTALTEDLDGLIAPMQGFFVKAKEAATSIDLKFTPDMAEGGEITDTPLRSPSAYQSRFIAVTALAEDGKFLSRAIINIDEEGNASFDASEDLSLLVDNTLDAPGAVYTVASGEALSINTLDRVAETEVGLLASDGMRSTLIFEGVDETEGLYLMDTKGGTMTLLSDGMQVSVDGSAKGRFYLVRGAEEELSGPEMAMVIKEGKVSIVSPADGIRARVYTPAGAGVGEWVSEGTALQFALDSGIFIVEAESAGTRIVRKFVVR